MRRILTVLVVTAVTFLGAGSVAEAKPATYKVSKSWLLAYRGPDRTPTVVPHIEDDVVEVTCRDGNQMIRYKVNDPALSAGAFRRVDGTGIQIQPEFADRTERLRVTITCRRA